MHILIGFLPILLFVLLYVGSGIYFTIAGVQNPFYQLSPTVAIIPAISLGFLLYKGSTEERIHAFLDGVRHRDIITMCIIFLLAGAFGEVTKAIGSVDATVNLALSLIPSKFLLIGVFLISAFISTAIGTSMGTIATIGPIAAAIAEQGAFPISLGMATVIGGSMFGDSLSVISDTTIAAVMSQEADMKAKLRLNAIVALIAAVITIGILFFAHNTSANISFKEFSLILIAPYLVLMLLAGFGVNVFIVLIIALVVSGCLGCIQGNYTVLKFSHDIAKGFTSMQDIMLLSLMVGGLSGLAGKKFKELSDYLTGWIGKSNSKKTAQLLIGKIVSIFDILLANNTVAIIFSGEIARNIAKKYHIPPHYSAAWLDIFSCVFQGLLPYGAQILLASSIARISPIELVSQVYFCYLLFVVAVLYILFNKKLRV